MKQILTPLMLAMLAALASSAPAADLPVPGTNRINGVVRFTNADSEILALLGPPGDEGISSFSIFAYTDPPDSLQSTKTVSSADRLNNPYEMTVVANDAPLTYQVYAALSLDGTYEEYWTAAQTAAPLTSNSPPATVDFDECVALIEVRYVDSGGQPVAALGGRALVAETAPPYYSWRARYLTQPPGRTTNFLVVPSGVEIDLSVQVDTGTDIYLDRLTYAEQRVLTLGCDEQMVITITIPDPGALGKISGNANLVGEIELPTDGYQELLGRPVIKASGPSDNGRFFDLGAEFPGPDSTRPFTLENLVPSIPMRSWNVWTEMQFRTGHRFEWFRSPGLGDGSLNPGAAVTGGETTDLGDTFVMNPAQLVGTITLTGPPEFGGNVSALRGVVRSADYDPNMDGIPDGVGPVGIGGSYVYSAGVDELAPGSTMTTAGASAIASFTGAFNPATAAFEGDYEVVVGMLNDQPGVWRLDGLSLVLYHPGTNGGPYVNQIGYITEDMPWQGVLAPGEQAHNNLRYGLAEVCLRIKSPVPFFYPRVVNSSGVLDGLDSENQLRSYRAVVQAASAPPYTADAATNEAVVTMYLPEGSYTLQPAFSAVDPDGGVSEVQLPSIDVSVVAGERYCIEDCLRLVFTGPSCTTNFGFLTFVDAFSCEATLTNLSLTTRPLANPGIRLGYSDIRILEPIGTARTTLRTGHGLFPEFDGFLPDHPEYYADMVITAEARDNKGRIATRQIIAHYDFTAPLLNCSNITASSENGIDAVVDYTIPISSDGILVCTPPGGTTFPVGTTPVTCTARDLCRNTNTCSFNVIVSGPDKDCVLRIALRQLSPPEVTLSWDCAATLQSAETLDGPWTSLDGVTSPHTTPAGSAQSFFRLCLSGDCSSPPPAGASAGARTVKSASAKRSSP
jgi:hypothetical protein